MLFRSAYINVVAVKTLVVGSWRLAELCPTEVEYGLSSSVFGDNTVWALIGFYAEAEG